MRLTKLTNSIKICSYLCSKQTLSHIKHYIKQLASHRYTKARESFEKRNNAMKFRISSTLKGLNIKIVNFIDK